MKMDSRLGTALGAALAFAFFLLGLNLPGGKAVFYGMAGFFGGWAMSGLFLHRSPTAESARVKTPEPPVPAPPPRG